MMTKNPLDNFDYRVDCADFLLYELGRLIEEDRASFEEEEFRRVIESGIHEHIERRLDVRTAMAREFRTSGVLPDRTLRAIEDIESPLSDIRPIVQSYTAYLVQRLETCSETAPDEVITAAADELLEAPGDRSRAEAAIERLASIRSAVSARVLAYVISEPMLDEDLETKAYLAVRALWPLPRAYILYQLKPHEHEDIPFRWFQLMLDCDEPSAVDRILEEVLVHGGDPDYREDLMALVELLRQARDPETENKIIHILNSAGIPAAATEMLEEFLSTGSERTNNRRADDRWSALDRVYAANRKYLAAAKLFDAGKRDDAAKAIDELLNEHPQYPFAQMLKDLS
jgi:hypothetical protein